MSWPAVAAIAGPRADNFNRLETLVGDPTELKTAFRRFSGKM
jgi:hypothetical protein